MIGWRDDNSRTDEQDGTGLKDGIGIEEEEMVLDDRMERMILDERIQRIIYR